MFVILALIVSRMGVSYLVILIAIGLIVSFINQRKREAIITGVLYALVSYILSYPSGLFLADYMPTTDIVIETSAVTVASDLIIGALIPMIIAFILCAVTAIIGSNISKAVLDNDEEKTGPVEGYHFTDKFSDYSSNQNENSYNLSKSKKTRKEKEALLNLTPIQKAKMKRQKGENDD